VEALVVAKSDDLTSLVPALGAFAGIMLLSGIMQALRAYCDSHAFSAHGPPYHQAAGGAFN